MHRAGLAYIPFDGAASSTSSRWLFGLSQAASWPELLRSSARYTCPHVKRDSGSASSSGDDPGMALGGLACPSSYDITRFLRPPGLLNGIA